MKWKSYRRTGKHLMRLTAIPLGGDIDMYIRNGTVLSNSPDIPRRNCRRATSSAEAGDEKRIYIT